MIDETSAAYKSIDAVMAAKADLVEIVNTLRQVVCVKGLDPFEESLGDYAHPMHRHSVTARDGSSPNAL